MADRESRGGHVHWVVPACEGFRSTAELEQRFEELMRGRWRPRSGGEPPVDVFLVGSELWVEVDLPGVAESQVRVGIEGGELVIEARRELEPPARHAPALRRERSGGILRRRLRLPRRIERPVVAVRSHAGVLEVRIRPADETAE
jgi:HSP20 family molecular chaperone IbpA